MGRLYIVSTPIGNLQDITLRALKTLFEVDVIACEDTRRAGILLETLSVPYHQLRNGNSSFHKPHLISYYEQSELRRIPEIISLLQKGQKVALITDAGTPAISDPGFKLIRECIRYGLSVESIPGPTAAVTALVSSGLPTDKFHFLGFPPHKKGHRKKFFENVKNSLTLVQSTVILYEAPHKVVNTLQNLQEVFGDIPVVLCREMTKVYEEIRRELISEAIEHFQQESPKGEFVILFHLA